MAADLTRIAGVLLALGDTTQAVGAEMVSATGGERWTEVQGPADQFASMPVMSAFADVRLHVFGYDAGVRLASRLGLPEVDRRVVGDGESWGPSEHITWKGYVLMPAHVLPALVEVLAIRDVSATATEPAVESVGAAA